MGWGEPAAPKQNGPLLVQTGRWLGKRVRYRLRPYGSSSSASEIRFMELNIAQFSVQT
jgi:hypothetical protein